MLGSVVTLISMVVFEVAAARYHAIEGLMCVVHRVDQPLGLFSSCSDIS